ncbi:glycosyltransferase family 2 protein [Nitrosomonas sp. Nm132]|uniref:glycosyltransferase family 2 protein n=1 Tax=Nitrosomonas sp. Nm132 TaxID=1881053 RepID=UPI00210CA503|nr:glycosyltransferase family 2 protein [Nitrosomonas sp. Nm132]
MSRLYISDIKSVSLVIVNYNAGSLLADCLQAALEQAQHVIVVDNASSDSSLVELEKRFPAEHRLQIIRLDKNVGFAAGCNIGLKAATTPFILFLNPDCMLTPGAVVRLMQVMEADSRVGMVGGQLLNSDGSEQGGSRRAIPTPWRSLVRAIGLHRLAKYWPRLFFDFHLHHQPLPEKPIEVEAISGALMLVRREVIEEVGAWDEGYFLHCEDLDWCMRFRQKGWKILFVPEVQVLHYKGVCSQARPIFVAWHKHRGMVRFYQKFFRDQYPGILMWLVTVGVWVRFGAVVAFHTISHLGSLSGLRRG